jgi:hypothetical protein
MIYDDSLVNKLCPDHLIGSYTEGLKTLSALRDGRVLHTATYNEFMYSPLHLAYKLQLLYDRAKKVRVELPKPPDPFAISDEPIRKWWKERKIYTAHMSVHEQRVLLHKSLCGCAIWEK